MLEIYFLARHVPFWAVPMMVLGAEFGYVLWLKKKKRKAYFCLVFFFFGLISVSFYAWAGGPEKSVQVIKKYYLHR
jgi:hypothetical protein